MIPIAKLGCDFCTLVQGSLALGQHEVPEEFSRGGALHLLTTPSTLEFWPEVKREKLASKLKRETIINTNRKHVQEVFDGKPSGG